MRHVILSIFVLPVGLANALVDTKNGNYTKTYKDISTSSFNLERSYNSRSLYKGFFGFGWCSNLETQIEVLPNNVLYVVECGGGRQVPYSTQKGSSVDHQPVVEAIMAKVRKKQGLTRQYILKVEKDLKKSPDFRLQLSRLLKLKGNVQVGKVYRKAGDPKDSVQWTGKQFKRRFKGGRVQIFNKEGFLVKQIEKSGQWIKIVRKNRSIKKILTSGGNSFNFRPNGKKNPGFTIKGSGTHITYVINKKDNLVKVTRMIGGKKETFEHFYDDYHNLIRTRYPNNTYETLTYNVDKDWVSGFKDRKGCLEDYQYRSNKRNSDHYWTDVKKTCGKEVTNVSRYEFWNKLTAKGGKYLYRAKQKVNGRIADITYDERTRSPLIVNRNGRITRYAYDPKTGLLISRKEPNRQVFFPISGYNKKCRKPALVQVKYLKAKKVVRSLQTKISYHPQKCYLTQAQQVSTGRWVIVKRDSGGRINEMYDQSKKRIVVQYYANGKPAKITRPGVGSIQVSYNNEGKIDQAKSATNPVVASQVASVFNGFLEIISPIASSITI